MTIAARRRDSTTKFCLLIASLAIPAIAVELSTSSAPAPAAPLFLPLKATPPTGVDIVLVVDNSASMGLEIQSLEAAFFSHLVAPLVGFDVDPRVIVVSRHGDLASEWLCFGAPLSSIPAGGCANPPPQPGITDMFKHYSIEIGSLDAWCLLISTFDGTTPDEFGLAPGGWSDWSRLGTLKAILMVTDDGVLCGGYDDQDSAAGGFTAAAAIDTDLLALSPTDFGTAEQRNYVVYSLIGLMANAPPNEPWPPSDPIVTTQCSTALAPGTGHQGMSILTTALRFPICSTTEYDTFLDRVTTDTLSHFPIFVDGFESGYTSAWSSAVP